MQLEFWQNVIFAGALGVFLYIFLFRPVGQAMCLFDDPACVRLTIQRDGKAFLADIPASGETFWYNGRDLVAYNIPSGDVCEEGDPAYAWIEGDRGFFCVKPLAGVRQMFAQRPKAPLSMRMPKGFRSSTGICTALGAVIPR